MKALRDRNVPRIAVPVLSAALALVAGPVSAETAADCAGVYRDTAPLFRAQLPREADLGPFRVQMDSTVSQSDFDYVVDLLSALLPYMEEIVGPPPFDSLSVWLDADLQYFSCASGIHMDRIDRSRDYDNDGDGRIDEDPFDSVDNDGDGLVDEDLAYSPVWDNVFIHELTHAYQRELLCGAAYPSWITEGMAEAARHFVSERGTRALGRQFQSRRFDRRMAVYDLYDSPGAQVLGGAGSIAYRFSFDVLYQNAAGAILVPALAQLTAGHESPHPLRRLSEELLREARGGSPIEMYEAVDRAWGAPVDGVFPPSRWLRGRAVTNRSVREGEFMTLLPNYVANGVNPPRLRVDRFTRREFEQIDPGPFPQSGVTFTDVGRRSFDAEVGVILPAVPDLPPGAYLAEITEPSSESGWPLSARSWILVVPPSFLEPSDRADVSVWKGVAAVFVDERGFPVDVPDVTVNGTIVGRVPGGLIAYPTSGTGGDLTFSRRGDVLGTVSVGESFRRMVVLHTDQEQTRGLVSWEPYRPTAGSSVRVRLKHRESSLPFDAPSVTVHLRDPASPGDVITPPVVMQPAGDASGFLTADVAVPTGPTHGVFVFESGSEFHYGCGSGPWGSCGWYLGYEFPLRTGGVGMLAYVQQVGDQLRAVFDAPIGDPGQYVLRLAATDAGPWTTHPDSPRPEEAAVLVWTLSTGSVRGPYARIVRTDTSGEEVLGSVRIDTVSIGPTLRAFPPWPNPSRSGVRWLVESCAAVPVSFRVLDVTGRIVHGPERMTLQRGRELLHWDGGASARRPAAGGVYFLLVEGHGIHVSERVVVTR